MCLRVASEVTLLEIPPCQIPMCGVAYSCSYVLLIESSYRQERPAREHCTFSHSRDDVGRHRGRKAALRTCVSDRLDVHVERQLERDEVNVRLEEERRTHRWREKLCLLIYMSMFALHEHLFFGRLFAYSVTSSCLLDRVRWWSPHRLSAVNILAKGMLLRMRRRRCGRSQVRPNVGPGKRPPKTQGKSRGEREREEMGMGGGGGGIEMCLRWKMVGEQAHA